MRIFILVILLLQGFALESLAVDWLSNQVFYSTSLGRDINFDVALPNNYSTNNYYPILYLLHGRNYHYECWRENSNVLQTMSNKNYQFIIVMPEGEYSWYMDEWMTYIAQDLPYYIESLWPNSLQQGIGGFSMGGYGAFNIAGQSEELYGVNFISVTSMSGAFVEKGISEALDDVTIRDRQKIASSLAQTDSLIYFDCGNEDVFSFGGLSYNLADKNDLMRDDLINVGKILYGNMWYYRPPGQHDWTYWNSRLPYHLKFHNKCFLDYPDIELTNIDENKTTTITTKVFRVEGIAFAQEGISRVTWQNKASGHKFDGTCIGKTNWYANVTNLVGKNELTFTAYSYTETNTSVKASLFLRDYNFRVRKVIVKSNRITAKTSDVTNGDFNSLTNGVGGNGIFILDRFAINLTNIWWKRTGKYNNIYKFKNDDWKVLVKVKGKAQKDMMLFKIKLYNTNLWPHNFFDVVNLETNNDLNISLGKYNALTNIWIDIKGKYKYNGSWF